ncbi:MAG: hypothetical protein AAF485_01655 [Chloroflexota bacterium]
MTQSKISPSKTLFILLTMIIVGVTGIQGFPAVLAAPPQQEGDVFVITSPANNAPVQGVVPIVGSANHPAFQFYILEFSPEPVTGDQWQIIGAIQEAAVLNGQLATWDTTVISDGAYTIRLRVVRLDGNYSEFFTQQVVVSNAQPIPTDTPEVPPTPAPPTITPTPLPPTAVIEVEQPVVDTPTPRPVETSAPLEDPEEDSTSLIPTVTGFSFAPLRDACLYGAVLMLSVFLLFGFLATLRSFIYGIVQRIRRSRNRRKK